MSNHVLRIFTILGCTSLFVTCEQDQPVAPELNFEESLQQQLILAEPGDVILIPEGHMRLLVAFLLMCQE